MILRLASQLAKLEKKQAKKGGVTAVVVCDENFYGNAHLLPRKAGARDGQGAGTDDGATSKPRGEDRDEDA